MRHSMDLPRRGPGCNHARGRRHPTGSEALTDTCAS
jgi:hypothetical protein